MGRLPGVVGTLIATVLLVGCGGGDEETRAGGPSAENAELAFHWTEDARAQVATAAADGDDVVAVVGAGEGSPSPEGFTSISPSPDGERIAFAASTDGGLSEPGDFGGEIYVVDTDGSGLRQVTDLGDARDPVWAPDGERLVFSRTKVGSKGRGFTGALFSVGVDGGEPAQLTDFEDLRLERPGSFSPDGETLAFTRTIVSSGRQGLIFDNSIRLISPEGSESRGLIEQASDPTFSPDGSRLAFRGERDHNGELTYGESVTIAGELYVARADGSKPRRLTSTEELNEAAPAWTANGERIAYQRGKQVHNAEAMSIRQINPDGSCDRLMLGDRPLGSWFASPAWIEPEPAAAPGPLKC